MITNYQMYLKSEELFRFPVLPEEITIKYEGDNDNINVCGIGEVTIMQDMSASIISFSSFFPNQYFSGCNYTNIPDPSEAVDTIVAMVASKTPVKFTLTGNMNISMYCTISSFKTTEKGGDIGSVYYDITLKEYKEVTLKQITVNSTTKIATISATSSRTDTTSTPSTYTVVSGDCLWNIAKKYYGSGSEYMTIYNANKSIIGSNPNLIYPGQVLTIP